MFLIFPRLNLWGGSTARSAANLSGGNRDRECNFRGRSAVMGKVDGSHLPNCRLIAQEESKILGWAALSPVSSRRVYAGVVEVSAYVAEAARGKGIGKSLLSALIESSQDCGGWTLQAGICPENTSSITFHKS